MPSSFDGTSAAAQRITSDNVRAFLLENPDFLEENEDLLNALMPLDPPKGERIKDFQYYRLAKLQDDFIALKAESEDLMDLMQEHLHRQNLINSAMFSLMDALDFQSFVALISHELLHLLDHAAVGFFLEAGGWLDQGNYDGLQVVAPGLVTRWLGSSDSALEETSPASSDIFGDKSELVYSQALIRITICDGLPLGLLALGHANPMYYATGLATEQVECLGGVVERCLRKFLL